MVTRRSGARWVRCGGDANKPRERQCSLRRIRRRRLVTNPIRHGLSTSYRHHSLARIAVNRPIFTGFSAQLCTTPGVRKDELHRLARSHLSQRQVPLYMTVGKPVCTVLAGMNGRFGHESLGDVWPLTSCDATPVDPTSDQKVAPLVPPR